MFTCVSGHLTNAQLADGYNDWYHPPPKALFDAPVVVKVAEVGLGDLFLHSGLTFLGQDCDCH